jgi:hypothetical protein
MPNHFHLLVRFKKLGDILNEDEQFVQTDENELPDDYKDFQEKIDNFYN